MIPAPAGSKADVYKPKRYMQRLMATAAVTLAVTTYFVFRFRLGVPADAKILESFLQWPVIGAVIVPFLIYALVRSDPLQYSPSRRTAIRFFQSQFPSTYLLERCRECQNDGRCPTSLQENTGAHRKYWFNDLFHGLIEAENPEAVSHTFSRSYTCKLVYYIQWVLSAFVLTSMALMLGSILVSAFQRSTIRWPMPIEILYTALLVVILGVTRLLNSPDPAAPTGCWRAWKEVNQEHRTWMRDHEPDLKRIICAQRQNTLCYQQKTA